MVPTSGRPPFTGAAPTKIGLPPPAGYAYTCTRSIPLSAAARSAAQPVRTNGIGRLCPSAGASIEIAGRGAAGGAGAGAGGGDGRGAGSGSGSGDGGGAGG